MNVNVTYRLSPAGQKAAIIAGRTATQLVREQVTFEDGSLIDRLSIYPDGSLHLDTLTAEYRETGLVLDAPPTDLATLIAVYEGRATENKQRYENEQRERREAEERRATEAREKAEHDAPLVDKILVAFEAMPLDGGDPDGVQMGVREARFPGLDASREQITRATAVFDARKKFRDDAKATEETAKEAARAAMIAEHGGIVFPVEGGLCSFSGASLWCVGQSKRWVGVFSGPKGIDKFLDSPRGEHSFSIGSLDRGDCIQGAGFDTNSRGKRRSESEWFGVVVRNEEAEIVVDLCGTRAATIKAAAKLKKEVAVSQPAS